MTDLLDLPEFLERDTLNQVRVEMSRPLAPDHALPQEFLLNEGFSYGEPDSVGGVLIAKDFGRIINKRLVNYSILAQLGGLLDSSPEAIFFTANSAIPCADVYRGIYDVLGLPRPILAQVDAKWGGNTEIDYLRRTLDGRIKAVVVDEMTYLGSNLEDARQLLLRAGARNIGCVIGRWYHHAHIEDIDILGTSSIYAEELQQIGRDIAAAFAASDQQQE